MSQTESNTVRLKVSAEVARIVKPGAPRDAQLAAARGALPLTGRDLLTVLFFLCRSQDAEIRKTAIACLRELPTAILLPVIEDETLHPQLLELATRARMNDPELMGAVIMHPAATLKTLVSIAEKATPEVLERLADYQPLLDRNPQLVEAMIANPAADKALKCKLGRQAQVSIEGADSHAETAAGDGSGADIHGGRNPLELDGLMEEAEQGGLSKYQIALQLEVSEKIKMAMTGDREWRAILIKDANKLVQAAVMKNPRITDGEVLQIAKNKSCSDEIVRIILLNKDWLKNYEVRKALVTHPKTPLPKALRFVGGLGAKDLKELARSRQVSNIIANAARKELELRIKKTGG